MRHWTFSPWRLPCRSAWVLTIIITAVVIPQTVTCRVMPWTCVGIVPGGRACGDWVITAAAAAAAVTTTTTTTVTTIRHTTPRVDIRRYIGT